MKRVLLFLFALTAASLCSMAQEVTSIEGAILISSAEPAHSTYAAVYAEEDSYGFFDRFVDWSTPSLDCKYELRIGMPELMEYHHDCFVRFKNHTDHYASTPSGSYEQSALVYGGKFTEYSPTIDLSFYTSSKWQYGVSGFYTSMAQNLYHATTGEVVASMSHGSLFVVPYVSRHLIRWSWLRAYVGVGIRFIFDHGSNYVSHDTQEFEFKYGYTVGRRLFFYQEGSFSDFFYTTMGIGYRF